MWDLRVAHPFGKIPLRNMVAFVAAVVAASFAFGLLFSHPAHAADAKWNGDSITYDGVLYQKALSPDDDDRGGLPEGTVYIYKEGVNGDNPHPGPQKAHVIYFAPGSDPGDSTKATYATYEFTPPNTYKNKSGDKQISIEKKSNGDKGSSCAVPGIGWLICPVSSFMSSAMDWMYKILAQFLEVQPVASDQENSLFKAWSVMRNIANVAFVIAFLVIIYSQISNIGISNYGIKKLLPRLVIAAVLVNISYWICAVAIDASNILGYSIKDIFSAVNDTVVKGGNNSSISWTDMTATVLSGGTLGAIGLLSVGSISGALYLLLPMLVALILSALVAIVIMAARQAIIVILVIIAPLAFVAYILPNTEKYFDKWRSLFLTMLMLFPIFGVLFGGAELAGTAIIQNATSFVMVILGMAVKVVPLAVMPFAIQFGGSLLGRIAGMVNNPNKGLVDRTRNWAGDQAAAKKAKNLARPNASWRRNGLSRTLQAMDAGRRKREAQQKVHETLADARWERSNAAHDLHARAARANLLKEHATHTAEAHVEGLKRTEADMQALDLQTRAAKLNVDVTKAKVEANWTDLTAGDTSNLVQPNTLALSALARQVQRDSRDEAIVGMRKHSAEQKRDSDLTNALIASSDPSKLAASGNDLRIDGKPLTEYGGGIRGVTGAETVLAGAVNKERSELRARVAEKQQLMKHFNVSNSDMQKLAMGHDNVTVTRDGVNLVFKKDDDYTREAAIESMLSGGSFGEIQDIIMNSGAQVAYTNPDGTVEIRQGATYEYRTSIKDAIIEKGLQKKALYYGHNTIDDVAQGKINGAPGLDMAAARSLANGKATDESVSAMGADALKRMFNVTVQDLRRSEQYINATAGKRAEMETKFVDSQQELKYSAWRVMNDNLLMRNADKTSRDVLHENAVQPPGT